MPDDLLVDRGRHRSARGGPPRRRRFPGRRGLRRGLSLLVLAAACAGLAVAYFHQSLSAPFNSDGAANVLQGQAIIGGNPLLRGWWTSDVSFYTTELPEYALVTAVRGLSPNVVHVCGALSYTLTVLLTALVARGRARGAAGYFRAGVATGIVLAPSVTGSIVIYLENPNHAGTAVPVLAFLLVLDRADGPAVDRARRGWLIPAAACAVLALAAVGDELTLAAATVPLAVVCAVRLATGRRAARRQAAGPLTTGPLTTGPLTTGRPRGGAGRDRAGVPRDGALLAAAAASVALAWLVNQVIRALGGFDLRPVAGVAAAPLSQVPANTRMLGQAIVLLFGASQPGVPHQPRMISDHGLVAAMSAFHVIGLLLAAAGLAAGIAASWSAASWSAAPWSETLRSRPADRVAQVLTAAILVLLAFGVFSTLLRSRSYVHEIAILLPLSAALAGRVLGPLAARRRPGRPRPVKVAALALGAWLALSVAEVCYTATWPAVQPSQQAVADWLAAHHEHAGLAGYWQAASTTVTSGGRVLVAPITLDPAPVAGQPVAGQPVAGQPVAGQPVAGQPAAAHQAAPYRWETSAGWYQPASRDATFVIAVTDPAAAGGGLPAAGVRARFGVPVAQYQVGQDVIMLYGYNLLTRLAVAPFPGPR